MEKSYQCANKFLFGVLSSKQNRLRCLGTASSPVCLGPFSADPVTVKSGVLNQIEGVRRESKFMLRDWQAASVPFHGD
jgi:hypothetical protein